MKPLKSEAPTSNRLSMVPPSPIRKLVPLAEAAKKRGVKVYHFNIGDPDVKTPKVMLNILKNWKRNPIGYSLSQGEPSFLDALQKYYHRLGFSFIKKEHIQVTLGGSEAISWAMFACTDVDTEIIVFEPFYANYNTYAVVNNVRLVPIPTSIKDGFRLPKPSTIEKKISKKTKAILFCNPNNPTGTVYTQSEIEMLVGLAKKHAIFLLADEVYREYTYDGKKQISILSYMQEIPDHAILLDSLSKRYSICGARLGTLVSLNPEIMSGVLRIGQGRLSAGLVDQIMASELVNVSSKHLKNVHDEYQKRRDVTYQSLKNIPGVVVSNPEGAFYIIAGLPVNNAEDFCQWLLTDFSDNNETLMLAPANGFYATPGMGKNEVRIAYVLKIKDLKHCIELFKKALEIYPDTESSLKPRKT